MHRVVPLFLFLRLLISLICARPFSLCLKVLLLARAVCTLSSLLGAWAPWDGRICPLAMLFVLLRVDGQFNRLACFLALVLLLGLFIVYGLRSPS